MNSSEWMAWEANSMMQTYGRLPVVVDHGKNATWYDVEGKKYIDFTSGIGVNSLGLCDEGWIEAVTAQLRTFQHCSNYFYNQPAITLAGMLTGASGLSNVFLANSGAEANEGAIKVCRKYSFDKYGPGRETLISLNNSFHGRTLATLTATGQPKFHQWFGPFLDKVSYSDPNMDAVRAVCDGSVCGIFVEPIQGESGVHPMDAGFLRELRAFCNEQDILLVFDEVQCGLGRTGALFAYQQYGVTPDVLTLAKGLGGGLPIGAFLCAEKCRDTLGRGMHGSTFGGNPTVCAGAVEVMKRMTPEFLADVTKKGEYLVKSVMDAAPKRVKSVRGKGLMIGFVVDGDPHELLVQAAQRGLLVLTAGSDVIRLLPPLSITMEEIKQGLEILIDVLNG